MPGLLIKDLPVGVHRQLKNRAARNHRSLSKEALAILEAALTGGVDRPALALLDRRRVRGAKPLTDSLLRRAKASGRP